MPSSHRQTTIIVLLSALTVLVSMGIRQSFGLFLQPISDSLDLGREVFSLAIALQVTLPPAARQTPRHCAHPC